MEMTSVLVFAPGCRLHPTQDVLLMPEGMLKLTGPSRDILARLDGTRSVNAIVDDLLQEFAGANENQVRTDVLALFERLEQRGVVRAKNDANR